MENVHVFEGVAYVPIKFIRDKERDWVPAGWLSKQMAHLEYLKMSLVTCSNGGYYEPF